MSSFGSCQLLGLLFPLLRDKSPLMRLIDFDHALSQEEQRAIFNSYKEIIQRHLYFDVRYRNKPLDVRYLAKNPTFTLRLRSLLDTFPDASVVCVVRDPYEAIPSMVSYITSMWSLVASPAETNPFRDALQGMCSEHYVYPKEVEAKMGSKFCFVKYENVVKDPGRAAREILRDLGVPANESVDVEKLKFTFKHRHSVQETLGLTTQEFEQRHHRVFEAYPEYSRL